VVVCKTSFGRAADGVVFFFLLIKIGCRAKTILLPQICPPNFSKSPAELLLPKKIHPMPATQSRPLDPQLRTSNFELQTFLFLFFVPVVLFSQNGQTYTLASPNNALVLHIEAAISLNWQLDLRGKPLTVAAPMSLQLEGYGVLGQQAKVLRTGRTTSNKLVEPEVHQKSASISEQYNELTLYCQGDWGVSFRAYDEGVAYRFFTNIKTEKGVPVTVVDETYAFRPAICERIFFAEEESFYSHNERVCKQLLPADLNETRLASLPTLVECANGVKVLLTETDLREYPGLWLTGSAGKNGHLRGTLPHYPKYTLETGDRDIKVTDREVFLARTDGKRNYPWRLFLVAERDADLLTNQMPWLLAEPSRIAQSGWIRPGKVAWDWWNNLNVYGVNFTTGINTATYKYFVDFAAEQKLEYIVLDEGWSDPGNLLKINPDLDMDALAAYAQQKSVGLILWTTWTSIDHQFDVLLPSLKRWGVKGLKIDFMQRDDQPVVDFYWRTAEKCAANRLLADFHGAHKPAGLQRTWPNVLSFEGVYGMENSKWDKEKRIDPEHNVTLPFIRMVAGPMDYTPGAMINSQKDDWSPSWSRPASLGTRCHELAKYVVFESPLQMLSDNPTNYRKEPECLQFLSGVPSVWEQTVALDGKVSDYVAIARQAKNGLWYIAAMTDWSARNLNLDTRFLPAGEYEIELFEDGINADRMAQDFRHSARHIKSGDTLTAKMTTGGGFVAVLRKL